MNREEIERLGTTAGREEVDSYRQSLLDEGGEAVLAALLATLAPGHLSWDEGARNAGAAEADGVHGHEEQQAYYAAFNRGAAQRVQEWCADAPSE